MLSVIELLCCCLQTNAALAENRVLISVGLFLIQKRLNKKEEGEGNFSQLEKSIILPLNVLFLFSFLESLSVN